MASPSFLDKSLNRYSQLSFIIDRLNDFRLDDLYSDVTLCCNGQRIRAHKLVLAAASPYFQALFYGNFPDGEKNEIELLEVHADSFVMAVDFIYGQFIELQDENVVQVMETANYLQLDILIQKCAEHMTQNLSTANCLAYRKLSDKWSCNMLHEEANDFILSNFREIVTTDDFLDMEFDEISSFLAQDQLYLHSDEIILGGIVRWANHQPHQRLVHLSQLLRYIHPACVNVQALPYRASLQHDSECSDWYERSVQGERQLKPHVFVMDRLGRVPCLQRFDEVFNEVADLPELPSNAFAVSLTGYKNILYAQGGDLVGRTSDSYYFNVYRNQWFKMPHMLMERSHHRSLVVNDCLYSLGGTSNTPVGVTASVETLNLHTNHSEYREDMNSKRSSCGAAIIDGVIYVCGGETERRALYSAERFDPREGKWHNLPSMSHVNSYTTCTAVEQYLYSCEGLSSCMERFDVRAHKWQLLNFCQEYEIYEIFTLPDGVYSVSGQAISRYEPDCYCWQVRHTFEKPYDWATVVTMEMVKEFVM